MEFVDLIKVPKVDNVVLHFPFRPSIQGASQWNSMQYVLPSCAFQKMDIFDWFINSCLKVKQFYHSNMARLILIIS